MDESVKEYRKTFQEVAKEMTIGKLTYQMPNRSQRKKILKAMKK